jgi:dienelactone hydrolase
MQGQRGSPFLVKEGRALVLPIWEGAFEHNRDGQSVARFYSLNARLEMLRHWRQDLARTLDYLEQRPDIRSPGVAFMGFSLGTAIAPELLPFEDRIGSALLLSGGFSPQQSQEGIDRLAGLVRRTRIPTLMLGSAFDTLFPPETHQKTFFDLLGAAPEDKRLRIFETGGHAGLPPAEVIKECLAWLEKYQGPVDR